VLYGEMADVVLHGQHVVPRRLLDEGFCFAFGNLDDALKDLV
jgi:NAD dependent epimerase/dehydratase family enzyme